MDPYLLGRIWWRDPRNAFEGSYKWDYDWQLDTVSSDHRYLGKDLCISDCCRLDCADSLNWPRTRVYKMVECLGIPEHKNTLLDRSPRDTDCSGHKEKVYKGPTVLDVQGLWKKH